MTPTLLALDTSTLLAGAALVTVEGTVVAERRARVTTHSEALLPMVRELLDGAGLAPSDLAAIACGAGPGSFTGLRIGLATAKGLCVATGAPLLLVSSLQSLARRAPVGVLAVAAIDAFKGEVYAGFYRRGSIDGAPEPEADESVLAPERLAALMAERAAREPVRLIGDVVGHWPVLAVPSTGGAVDASDQGPPDAADVGRLAALRFARGERDDLAAAVPSYVRPSEAELHAGRVEKP
jgi:tRNA threonylcarbamoyladenosine biosynthesis protein TsaB